MTATGKDEKKKNVHNENNLEIIISGLPKTKKKIEKVERIHFDFGCLVIQYP